MTHENENNKYCTVVFGLDAEDWVVYVRTFDYDTEKAEAQAAYKWCIDNCASYCISDRKLVNIQINP